MYRPFPFSKGSLDLGNRKIPYEFDTSNSFKLGSIKAVAKPQPLSAN
jgi:hypothetical protein